MKKISIIIFSLIYIFIHAQVEYPGTPLSFTLKNYEYKYGSVLSYISSDSLLQIENERRENTSSDVYIQKIGIIRDFEIDLMKNFQIDSSGDQIIASYKIKSPGAKSVKLLFANLRLSNSSKLYVFDNNRTKFFGAFGKEMETESGQNVIRSFKNDEIILELNCHKKDFLLNKIMLYGIGHNFDPYNSRDYLESLPCHNNVNDNQYIDWCNEIRSVVKIETFLCCSAEDGSNLSYGTYVGTAYLYNAKNPKSRKFLTAFHNLGCRNRNGEELINCTNNGSKLAANYDFTLIYFNFQSPEDYNRDPQLKNDYTLNGGLNVVGECYEEDMLVFETKKEIPLQYNYFYAGWDLRSYNSFENKDITVIGHPAGDIKKITLAEWQDPYVNQYRTISNGFILGFYYKGINKSGIVQHGNSGSPVFNHEHRVVGTVSHGDPHVNCETGWFNFGKLNHCFAAGVSFRDGMDPVRECIDNVQLDGIFADARKYRLEKHNIKLQGKNVVIGSREDTEFRDYSNFTITSVEELNITGDVASTVITNDPALFKNYSGVEVEFFNTDCDMSQSQCGFNYFKMANANQKTDNLVEKEKNVFDLTLHPNPTTQNSTLTLVGYNDRQANILVLDQTGKIIFSKTISKVENEKVEVEIESRNWTNGIYIIRVECNENTKAVKLVKE